MFTRILWKRLIIFSENVELITEAQTTSKNDIVLQTPCIIIFNFLVQIYDFLQEKNITAHSLTSNKLLTRYGNRVNDQNYQTVVYMVNVFDL